MNHLGVLFLVLRSFHTCPVYCPLLFAFGCFAVSVMGHLTVDSARS
jgi:hypothetical protein